MQLVKIEFRTDKKWIEENNIDVNSIKLYRLVDTSWTPIYTVRIDETSYSYHFLAETTGFSIFAIGGSVSTEPPEEPQPEDEQIPVQAPPQTPAQASSDMLGLVIIIAGVVVLVIMIGKLKGRHKKEENVSNPFLRSDSSG